MFDYVAVLPVLVTISQTFCKLRITASKTVDIDNLGVLFAI